MRVRDLSSIEISELLRSEGLNLSIGPYVFRCFSNVDGVARAVGSLYGDFVVDSGDFADFLFGVNRVSWWKKPFSQAVETTAEGSLVFEAVSQQNAFAFWEWGINRCVSLYSQHQLMVHAAVLARKERALVIVGASGAGKSTLCAGLMLDGWRLLSDEFAIMPLYQPTNDGGIDLLPLVKPIALKNESIDVIRQLSPHAVFGPVSPTTIKGDVAHLKPDAHSVENAELPAGPAMIVFVNHAEGIRSQMRPVSRGMTMYRLGRNSFNFGLTGREGFETLARFVDQSSAFDLVYSSMESVREVLRNQFDQVVDSPLEVLP